MTALILNAGSSTLKAALFENGADQPAFAALFESPTGQQSSGCLIKWREGHSETLQNIAGDARGRLEFLARLLKDCWNGAHTEVDSVVHRVVHGGTTFTEPTVFSEAVESALRELIPLAPLHQPQALQLVDAAKLTFPAASQIAVFDTAYFAELPEIRRLYPVPYDWYERFGICRFGFHGISHEWSARQAAKFSQCDLAEMNLISCHLGGGCSATAIQNGRPIATSMGFTPLDGLMMGSRPGSIDPGILLYLLKARKLSVEQIEHAMERNSGLQGISGASPDLYKLEPLARHGHRRARLALDMFADRARREIGAMAVTLGRLDALVLTGGIGEYSASIREMICTNLDLIGLKLDLDANRQPGLTDLATGDSPARILVFPADEELAMHHAVQSMRDAPRNGDT